MSDPFVRPYDPAKDFEACILIFNTTIDKTLDFEPARTIGSHIWCRPYLLLSPRSCFVLDDGNGLAVGYIIGTPDTLAFAAKWKSDFLPTVDANSFTHDGPPLTPEKSALVDGLKHSLYEAECSDIIARPDILAGYPAHLHIDIEPAFQGRGFGALLVARFLKGLREEGAAGVHLGMVRWNEGAKRFYERLGFATCKEVLDGGVSGETGRKGDAVCLVLRV
ncbi:GCN5-related N-acetyltransferas-like protein [Aaosphaeria arxii CBS 175.79]|uniref:GCN5-related N-acetyltransferas-like protein n=1 Tax=Aaosphaeria arxii CBS 175.79 TaxID=1450172 RepID=A0A6A5X6J4_9PLEO|nr:GCN5-related N-acetyltransferas-like protein [Aaosphaeria arxii CBS 175.79]KAF2008530.1 GCN5-related N-acetyltransferas-like protein [Aaosphaeria arxii CBS 175.79]